MEGTAMTDRYSGKVAEGRNPDGTFAPGNLGRQKGTRLKVIRAVERTTEQRAIPDGPGKPEKVTCPPKLPSL